MAKRDEKGRFTTEATVEPVVAISRNVIEGRLTSYANERLRLIRQRDVANLNISHLDGAIALLKDLIQLMDEKVSNGS